MSSEVSRLRELKQAVQSGEWEDERDYKAACIAFAEAALAAPSAGAEAVKHEAQTRFGKLPCSLAMSCAWDELVAHVSYLEAALAAPSAGAEAVGYLSQSGIDAMTACRGDKHNGMTECWMRPTAPHTVPVYTAPPAATHVVDEAMVERAYEKLRGWLPNQTDTGRALSRQVIRDALTAAITGGRS